MQKAATPRSPSAIFTLNVMSLLLPAIVGVVAIPPVLFFVGSSRFAILAIIWATIGLFSILDLGIGRAITHKIATTPVHTGAPLGSIVWSGLVFQFVLVALGSGILAMFRGQLAMSLFKDPAIVTEAAASIGVTALMLPVVVLGRSLVGILEGAHQFMWSAALRVPQNLSVYLGPLLGVSQQWDIPTMILATAVMRIVFTILTLLVCLRNLPALRIFNINGNALRATATFGAWVTLSAVIAPLFLYGDKFLLGWLSGSSAVTAYSIPHEVLLRSLVLASGVTSVLFPLLARAFATAGRTTAYRLWSTSQLALTLLLGVPLSITLIAADDLLVLWLGDAATAEMTTITRVLIPGIFLNGLAFVPYSVLHAANRPDLTAKIHLLEIPLYLISSIFAIKYFGAIGAAVVWTGRAILDMLLMSLVARPYQGVHPNNWPNGRARAGLFLLGWTGLLLLIDLLAGAVYFFVVAAALVIPSFPIVWRFVLEDTDRRALKGRGPKESE